MSGERLEHGGVTVTWDPATRVARFDAVDDGSFTGEAADAIIPRFASWVRARDAPYGILVDATRVSSAGGDWRMRWAAYHRGEGGRARIAIVQPNLFVRTLLAGYGRITGTSLRSFPSEAAARAWLSAELRQ